MTPRVVSLLPSATETVCALGLRDALIGRSHQCDFPPGIEELPICTSAKIDPRGSSPEIHASVERILRDALSVYRVDAALLHHLRPTHIVTQVQCDVCAVSLDDVKAALANWDGASPELIALNPAGLQDLFADFERTAVSLDVPDHGAALLRRIRDRIEGIAAQTKNISSRPRVASIEWLSPLMSAGNWMPELIELAGGENLFGQRGQHSAWLAWDELSAADPDVLVLFPCGFSLEKLKSEIHLVASQAAWNELRAVRTGQVYLTDGNQYFNRPGPRIVETLEILAEILHPDRFDFGHEGRAWERWQRGL